jgi:hypothetical protein
MKDDDKVKMPNGAPKILIPLDGVVNWDGVLKFGGRLEGDHATHFKGWMERPIAQSLVWKCSHAKDTIIRGPMMYVVCNGWK